MTIETLWAPVAGKFGRTRDGRKVGPMQETDPRTCRAWPFYGSGLYVLADGRSSNCANDLVSEWIDDPAPAQPIDFSKIRIGDRVRLGGEFEVDRVSINSVGIIVRGSRMYFGPDHPQLGPGGIVDHAAAPRPIEIGCTVRHRSSGNHGIVRTDCVLGYVLVEMAGCPRPGSWNVEDLTRIDCEVA